MPEEKQGDSSTAYAISDVVSGAIAGSAAGAAFGAAIGTFLLTILPIPAIPVFGTLVGAALGGGFNAYLKSIANRRESGDSVSSGNPDPKR